MRIPGFMDGNATVDETHYCEMLCSALATLITDSGDDESPTLHPIFNFQLVFLPGPLSEVA